MTPRKSTTKGRSLIAPTVDAVKNSRTDSNSRICALKAPVEPGLAASRSCITRSNSRLESSRSRPLPVTSSRWARRLRSTNSNTTASATPLARIHRVS